MQYVIMTIGKNGKPEMQRVKNRKKALGYLSAHSMEDVIAWPLFGKRGQALAPENECLYSKYFRETYR